MAGVDLRPGFRVPSFIEIAGGFVGLIPLMVSKASVSSTSMNGEVTSFEYRDWIAVGCGVAAAICGLVSFALLVRTDPAKRLPRVAIAVILVGLGALQIARGFGAIGVDRGGSSTTTFHTEVIQSQRMEPPMPAVDVDTPTVALFDAWRAGRTKEIHDAAHPIWRESSTLAQVASFRDDLVYGYGAFEKVGPLAKTFENDTLILRGNATHAKATLEVRVEYLLRDGKPLLSRLHFEIPERVQIRPKPEAAAATARELLDSMLAKKLDLMLLDPALREKLPADFDNQLAAVLKKLGKVKQIGEPTAKDCPEGRCLEIAVIGAKAKATFTAELAFQFVRWRARAFNLNVPE